MNPPTITTTTSSSCERHPEESFTSFCPTCLCERLSSLPNPQNTPPSNSSRKPPLLKTIFKPSSSSSSSSLFPELRRTKSFSDGRFSLSGRSSFEPRRKSCDVNTHNNILPPSSSSSSLHNNTLIEQPIQQHNIQQQQQQEEEEKEEQATEINDAEVHVLGNVTESKRFGEIVEEEEEEELKTMKTHIDLDSQAKKTPATATATAAGSSSGGKHLKEIAGTFWSAASVFSKKLQKWRNKQQKKKNKHEKGISGGGGDGGGRAAALPVEKPMGRQFRETQSEVADYGFGRRSCDTDPRFSLDIGRMSLDAGRVSLDNDPRYSIDEPRASWDGYLIGARIGNNNNVPRMMTMMMPPMLSNVVEDDVPVVQRSDTHIPIEEQQPPRKSNSIVLDDQTMPGGTMQTREYYSDSSSRRRKSLDRSNSARKIAAAVVAEMDELKLANSNPKVANSTGECNNNNNNNNDRVLRDSNSNLIRDECLEGTFELGFGDNVMNVCGDHNQKGSGKKSRRWSKGWNIFGLINRKGGNKEEEDRYSRSNTNGTERSFSESWHDLGSERIRDNANARNVFNPKLMRSNSSVSWRNGQSMNGSFGGSMRKNGFHKGRDNNNDNNNNNRDEFVLERNRSARYSTSDADNNGLWRFYLTPGGGWRNIGSSGKARSSQAQSIARSVLRLY